MHTNIKMRGDRNTSTDGGANPQPAIKQQRSISAYISPIVATQSGVQHWIAVRVAQIFGRFACCPLGSLCCWIAAIRVDAVEVVVRAGEGRAVNTGARAAVAPIKAARRDVQRRITSPVPNVGEGADGAAVVLSSTTAVKRAGQHETDHDTAVHNHRGCRRACRRGSTRSSCAAFCHEKHDRPCEDDTRKFGRPVRGSWNSSTV